jgi:hypothetical protein
VKVYARIALLLGAYLLAGGLVYGATDNERMGLMLLLVGGGGFAYVGVYAWRAVRAADRASRRAGTESRGATGAGPGGSTGGGPGEPDAPALDGDHGIEPVIEEVRPTIWPLVFSLAGAGIVAGVLVSHWILLAGGLLAVAAAAGWFREVLTQRHGHG